MSSQKIPYFVFCFILNLLFEGFSMVFTAADVIQFLGFLNIDIPDTKFNTFLIFITSDIGKYASIPIILTLICNSVFSNHMMESYWNSKIPLISKILLNIVDLIFEYTAICLANISIRLVDYNFYLSIALSLMLGSFFVLDFYSFLYSGFLFMK